MRCLIVDDETLARNALELTLHAVRPDAEAVQAANYREALQICETAPLDVVFLDVEMPGMDGLSLAREILLRQPRANLVFVTGHAHYALDAFRLYASAYLVKPVSEKTMAEALTHLRAPVEDTAGKALLTVRCFGNFEVRAHNQPVRFRRTRAKELLACLVLRRGTPASPGEICAVLWANGDTKENRTHLRQIAANLRTTLRDCGADGVLQHYYNSYAVNPAHLDCDYYRFLDGGPAPPAAQGFMRQYAWAEKFAPW